MDVGSITDRCWGKWALTHSGRIKDRTRETAEIEPKMDGLYGKSKKYIDIQNYIVALPEGRDTFHSLKMVGKGKKRKIKVEKINKWSLYC